MVKNKIPYFIINHQRGHFWKLKTFLLLLILRGGFSRCQPGRGERQRAPQAFYDRRPHPRHLAPQGDDVWQPGDRKPPQLQRTPAQVGSFINIGAATRGKSNFWVELETPH